MKVNKELKELIVTIFKLIVTVVVGVFAVYAGYLYIIKQLNIKRVNNRAFVLCKCPFLKLLVKAPDNPDDPNPSESVRITLDKMKGPKYEKIYKWQAL